MALFEPTGPFFIRMHVRVQFTHILYNNLRDLPSVKISYFFSHLVFLNYTDTGNGLLIGTDFDAKNWKIVIEYVILLCQQLSPNFGRNPYADGAHLYMQEPCLGIVG